jgi:hypothetical protein
MRTVMCCALGVGLLAGSAGLAAGAIVTEGGSGFADTNGVWGGKVRNMTHTNGDWEMSLGESPGHFSLHRHSTWAASGVANTFSLSYSNVTGQIDLVWNGDLLSWTDTDKAESVVIQLLARGKSGGEASFVLGDLVLNGESIDLGLANPFAEAGSSSSNGSASWLHIDGDAFDDRFWTLSGTLTAEWTGGTPSRDLSRIEFIGSSDNLVVPAPAGVALAGLSAWLVAPRRKRG